MNTMNDALLHNKEIFQLGIVVEDFDRAVAAWRDLLGKDPDSIAACGCDEGGVARQACWNLPNTMIELLAPDKGDSVWRRHLDKNGPGIQHCAFRFADPQKAVAALNAKGFETVQESPHTKDNFGNAYIGTFGALGVDIEILDVK